MKTIFQAELENGAIIKDDFYFKHSFGKGTLESVFKNWKDLIANSYHAEIKKATYEFAN